MFQVFWDWYWDLLLCKVQTLGTLKQLLIMYNLSLCNISVNCRTTASTAIEWFVQWLSWLHATWSITRMVSQQPRASQINTYTSAHLKLVLETLWKHTAPHLHSVICFMGFILTFMYLLYMQLCFSCYESCFASWSIIRQVINTQKEYSLYIPYISISPTALAPPRV